MALSLRRAMLAAALAALVAVVLLPRIASPPTPDVSWLLYAAGRLVDGGRLGRDVVEVNPPLILWLKMPVVMLARALGASPTALWMAAIALLAGVVAWFAARMLEALPFWDARAARTAGVLTLLACLAVPRWDFGQREHLAFLLTLPLLAVAARRVEGVPVRPGAAVLAGVAGGVGLCVKPYFLLVPVALFLLASRRGRAAWRAPEHATIVLVGALYVVAVIALAPGWLALAARFAAPYARYLVDTVPFVAAFGEGAPLAWLGVLGWFALRRETARGRGAADVLGVTLLAFLAVAVLQRKGWRYQFLPAMLTATLLLALLVATVRAPGTLARRLVRVVGAATVASLLTLGAWDGVRSLLGRPLPRPDLDPNLAGLAREIAGAGQRPTLALLSSNIGMTFPLAEVSHARWWSRHPSLWALQLDDLTTRGADGVRRCRAPGTRDALARTFLDEMTADLVAARPDVLVLPVPDTAVRGWGGALRVDYLGCLRAEPMLRDWLDGYRASARVGPYMVFRRAGPA